LTDSSALRAATNSVRRRPRRNPSRDAVSNFVQTAQLSIGTILKLVGSSTRNWEENDEN
jgi:hypothetical protein